MCVCVRVFSRISRGKPQGKLPKMASPFDMMVLYLVYEGRSKSTNRTYKSETEKERNAEKQRERERERERERANNNKNRFVNCCSFVDNLVRLRPHIVTKVIISHNCSLSCSEPHIRGTCPSYFSHTSCRKCRRAKYNQIY